MSDDESVATKSIANPNGNDQDLGVFEKDLETADDPPMTQEILDPNGALDDLAGGGGRGNPSPSRFTEETPSK